MVYLNGQRPAPKSSPAESMNGQSACRRCGTCCSQGGPALHRQDLDLITSGRIPLDRLITVRKGELAHNPLTGRVQAVRVELVKIAGTGEDWRCSYYDAEKRGCGIYGHRPQACEVLQCWDTEAILALVEKDLLSRLDIVDPTEPLARLIGEHEERCPCPRISRAWRTVRRTWHGRSRFGSNSWFRRISFSASGSCGNTAFPSSRRCSISAGRFSSCCNPSASGSAVSARGLSCTGREKSKGGIPDRCSGRKSRPYRQASSVWPACANPGPGVHPCRPTAGRLLPS